MRRLLVASGLAAIALAGGSAPARASTDLAGLLPDPPTSGWSQASGSDVLAGPFTAASYAAWVNKGSSSSKPTMDPSDLTSVGFVAGYAKEWAQSSTNDVLVERVFEFDGDGGADSWYSGIKQQTLKLSSYKSDISGAIAIPNAFGVVLSYSEGDQWRLDFRENNLVFIVHADSFSKGEDLSNLALGQAGTIYTLARSSPPPMRTVNRSLLVAGGAVIAAVVVITLLVLIALIAANPWRRPPQAAIPHSAYLSPDGRYWWDGAAWQPTGPGSTGPV